MRPSIDTLRACLILCVLAGAAGPAPAQPTRWVASQRGPFAVGFRTQYAIDYSRTWELQRDSLPPFRVHRELPRPIRISVWYPAQQGATPMPFAGYLRYALPDSAFSEMDAVLRHRDSLSYRNGDFRGNDTLFTRLMGMPTAVALDAPPATGRFPLVVYSAGWNSQSPDNTLLAEYLASHGYVVATVPQLPRMSTSAELALSLPDLQTQQRDVEVAFGLLGGAPNVDPDRVAFMGYSMGGVVTLWLSSRHPSVRALIGLDPSYMASNWQSLVRSSPDFDVRRIRAPMLVLQSGNAISVAGQSSAALDSLQFTDRINVRVGATTHGDFSDFPMIARDIGGVQPTDRTLADAVNGHEAIMQMARQFLDGTLGEHVSALDSIRRGVSSSADVKLVVRWLAGAPVPTSEELVALVVRAGADSAAAMIHALRRRFPHLVLDDEAELNTQGYGLLSKSDPHGALAVFTLITALHPGSANAYDSMADGCLAAGDKLCARRAYERELAVVDRDPALSPAARKSFRQRAMQQLAMLR